MTSKPLVWLHGEVNTPPFSTRARAEAGYLLRLLQEGEPLSLPESRPMPSIGARCHELRVIDEDATWRILYGLTSDAVVILKSSRKRHERHRSTSLTWRSDPGNSICRMRRKTDAS